METACALDSLPTEILCDVQDLLDPRSFLRLSATNKTNRSNRDDLYFKRLLAKHLDLNDYEPELSWEDVYRQLTWYLFRPSKGYVPTPSAFISTSDYEKVSCLNDRCMLLIDEAKCAEMLQQVKVARDRYRLEWPVLCVLCDHRRIGIAHGHSGRLGDHFVMGIEALRSLYRAYVVWKNKKLVRTDLDELMRRNDPAKHALLTSPLDEEGWSAEELRVIVSAERDCGMEVAVECRNLDIERDETMWYYYNKLDELKRERKTDVSTYLSKLERVTKAAMYYANTRA